MFLFTPILHVLKRAELAKEITTALERWEELKSEQRQLLYSFEAKDDGEMKASQQKAHDMESTLQKLATQAEKDLYALLW